MFQYTVVKDLCHGSIIKRRISEELFLFFKECENVVILLPGGLESLEEENLGIYFEILGSKDYDHKRIFVLRWQEKELLFIYQLPVDITDRSQLKCAVLVC